MSTMNTIRKSYFNVGKAIKGPDTDLYIKDVARELEVSAALRNESVLYNIDLRQR